MVLHRAKLTVVSRDDAADKEANSFAPAGEDNALPLVCIHSVRIHLICRPRNIGMEDTKDCAHEGHVTFEAFEKNPKD
jgi:hypothetical protein